MHLCLYVSYFSFLYLFSCLLINAHRYIHFGFHVIPSYLVSVPLFKGHRGFGTQLFVCLFTDISVSRWVFWHFDYFVLSPLVFLINFVTDTSFMLKYETKKKKKKKQNTSSTLSSNIIWHYWQTSKLHYYHHRVALTF